MKFEDTLPALALSGANIDVTLSPLTRVGVGPFDVVFTLMRAGQPIAASESIQNHERLVGDSQIAFDDANHDETTAREVMISGLAGAAIALKLHSNAQGRLSKVEVGGINALSEQEARRRARGVVHALLNRASVHLDVPVPIYQSDVFDPSSGNWNVTTRIPFATALWSEPAPMKPEFDTYAALYREGIGTQQSVYAFLCFLKISEKLTEQSRQLAPTKSKRNSRVSFTRYVVPRSDDEIREWARRVFPSWYRWNAFELASIAPAECRGLEFTTINETFLAPLKATIKSTLFDPDDPVNIFDSSHIDAIDRWLPYLRLIARTVILDASS